MENKNCENCNCEENYIEIILKNGKEYHFDTTEGDWELALEDFYVILSKNGKFVAMFDLDGVISFVSF